MKIDLNYLNSVSQILEDSFDSLSFEFNPFQIGWYNDLVQPSFKLAYNEDTVAFTVISTPKMFERVFVPFLKLNYEKISKLRDPIDECMTFYFSKVSEIFHPHSVKVIHDFELHSNRLPVIVMQSAAHASGAAILYHPDKIDIENHSKDKLLGVCIHPEYGGWFALRAVFIFENITCPEMVQTLPKDVISSKSDKVKLLQLFNFHWADWRYRDIIQVKEKYSDLQTKYFNAKPDCRQEVIKEILANECLL